MKKSMSLLLIISLILCASCNTDGTPKRQTIIFKEEWLNPKNVMISLRSTWNIGYDFILMPNKKLITIKGLITVNYSAGDPVEIIEYVEKNLTEYEWNDLSYIKDNLGDYDGEISYAVDAWEVRFSVNDQEYCYTYGLSKNEMYDIFVVKTIHYSAIEVVNNSGDSVMSYSLDWLADTNFGNYYNTQSDQF